MLKHRIFSGCLIGGALVLAVSYLSPLGMWLVLVVVASQAQLEFYAMMNAGGIPVFRVLGTVCGVLLISVTFFGLCRLIDAGHEWESFVMLASLIAVFIRQLPQKHNPKPLETIGCTLLGIWYVSYLLNFFVRLAFSWDGGGYGSGEGVVATGRLMVLYLVVVVKMADIGAYCVGRICGRHKLFPRISPGKTWEGFLGGTAFAVGASLLFAAAGGGRIGSIGFSVGHAVVLGCLLACAGTVGDLFESLLKRASGIKDSSSAIPGMGGILDVLDSLLFSAPVLYVYAKALLA